MVLQNKYKARASRRYKATHNIEPRDNTKSKHGEHAESASNQQEDNSGDTSGLPKTSNAWRYQEPESQDEEEEEPHVDLTSLNQRIAKMDVNERMQFEKAHSDEEDTGEGIFYESAPTSKVQTISADQVEQMKKEIESADAERGAYPANRTPQPLPPPAPAAHEFDDIDDFLESIDAQETQPAQHPVKPAAPLPSVSGDLSMQNYLDDLIG